MLISSCLAMQNAIMANEVATIGMMNASDRLMNSALSAGNSQPLRPAFSSSRLNDELIIKANETKVTVLKKLIEALNKKTAKDIKNSVPKFSGLDYKA